jgi:hypothetical protein
VSGGSDANDPENPASSPETLEIHSIFSLSQCGSEKMHTWTRDFRISIALWRHAISCDSLGVIVPFGRLPPYRFSGFLPAAIAALPVVRQ